MKTRTLAVLALLLVLAIPTGASAAVTRAFAEPVLGGVGDGTIGVCADYFDGSTQMDVYCQNFNMTSATNGEQMRVLAEAAITSYATGQGWTLTNGIYWVSPTLAQVNSLIAAAIPAAPSSYQTIVSQTGTGAPAVSGGFSPMNSYAGGPTFTWARSSAGVYTLTASSAVFNTSGKTGVFITPLQNLNANVRAVVTSSTVITVTTGVQSVAILGLLGLTATPTDALLSNTMIYVQTYP